MYLFLLNMWTMGKVTEEKLKSYYPKYISSEELNRLLAITPNV